MGNFKLAGFQRNIYMGGSAAAVRFSWTYGPFYGLPLLGIWAVAEALDLQRCPECGFSILIRDNSTGEVACRSCGLVLGEVEYAPPFAGEERRGAFRLVSGATGRLRPSEVKERHLRMVGRREGDGRTEANLASEIAKLAGWIGAGKNVEEEAMLYAKKLMRALRKSHMKMKIVDMAAVALWRACEVQVFPVTWSEYERMLGKSLYKLMTKANGAMPAPGKPFTALDYVGRLAAKVGARVGRSEIVAAVEGYARLLCKNVNNIEVQGRDPVCVAATALCVADELLGGRIGKERIIEAAEAGYSPAVGRLMKACAPPPQPFMYNAACLIAERAWEELFVSYSRLKSGARDGGGNARAD